MRWFCLILFSPKYRNEKGLFKKILAGDNPLGERSWETFLLNFLIGIIAIVPIVIAIIYLRYR